MGRVERPWGHYSVIAEGDGYKVKRITVSPGGALSLQMHYHRAEHWTVVSGMAEVTCASAVFLLKVSESTFIPKGATHKLVNASLLPLELIEVQTGVYLGEDDIVRFDSSPVRVCVSGGFDPVHIGHLRLFKAARALGDSLTVIVNNDNWLRKKKGFVFMPEAERAELIRGFEWVSEVYLTRHTNKSRSMSVCRDLGVVRPDIFANGGDRWAENTPEAETCARLGIQTVFGVGGDKIQSSSQLTKDYCNA